VKKKKYKITNNTSSGSSVTCTYTVANCRSVVDGKDILCTSKVTSFIAGDLQPLQSSGVDWQRETATPWKDTPVATVNVRWQHAILYIYVDSCAGHFGCRVALKSAPDRGDRGPDGFLSGVEKRARTPPAATASAVSTGRGAGTRHRHVHEQACAEHRAACRPRPKRCGPTFPCRWWAGCAAVPDTGFRPRASSGQLPKASGHSVRLCGPTSLDDLHVRNVFTSPQPNRHDRTIRWTAVTLCTRPGRLFRRPKPGRGSQYT